MTLYVDASALLMVYLDQPQASVCEELLLADTDWVTARHTLVEIRRNLAKVLAGPNLDEARTQFDADWRRMAIVELDEGTCDLAAVVAEMTGARTLDALHLAAAKRVGVEVSFLTYDRRQAAAARSLGLTILGV